MYFEITKQQKDIQSRTKLPVRHQYKRKHYKHLLLTADKKYFLVDQ